MSDAPTGSHKAAGENGDGPKARDWLNQQNDDAFAQFMERPEVAETLQNHGFEVWDKDGHEEYSEEVSDEAFAAIFKYMN